MQFFQHGVEDVNTICWKFNFLHHPELAEPSWVGPDDCFACNWCVGSSHIGNLNGWSGRRNWTCRHLWVIRHGMKVMLTMMWSHQYYYDYYSWGVLFHPSWSKDLFASPVYSHRDQGLSYSPYASAWQCQSTILLRPSLAVTGTSWILRLEWWGH